LALHRFIPIFLLDEDPAGGKLVATGPPFCEPKMGGAQIIVPVLDVFREGEKTFVICILPDRTVFAVLFFYVLSPPLCAITMSRPLNLIALKLVAELLCFLYYPSGQVFGHGGRHTQITP